MTNTRAVAELFGKRHNNVLRAHAAMECSPEFRALNFEQTSVTVPMPRGGHRADAAINMTKDGFVFLVMGFTGMAAAKFKEAYIARFNELDGRGDHHI